MVTRVPASWSSREEQARQGRQAGQPLDLRESVVPSIQPLQRLQSGERSRRREADIAQGQLPKRSLTSQVTQRTQRVRRKVDLD